MREPTRLRHDPSGRSSEVDVLLRGARRPQPPAPDDLARLGAVVDGLSRQPHVSGPHRWLVGGATTVAVIIGLGTGVWALRGGGRAVAPQVSPVVVARARVEAEPPSPIEQPTPPAAAPEPRVTTARSSARRPARPAIAPRTAPAAPTARTTPSGDTLAREIALIDAGRANLVTAPTRALATLEAHRREFPNGQLAAEREFLAVEALLAARRTDEARRRAADLGSRYPSSSYAARAARLLQLNKAP